VPVVGFLHGGSQAPNAQLVSAFRKGLSETGFDEGRNVVIEYRWADGYYDRLPGLANELVSRRVTFSTQAAAQFLLWRLKMPLTAFLWFS